MSDRIMTMIVRLVPTEPDHSYVVDNVVMPSKGRDNVRFLQPGQSEQDVVDGCQSNGWMLVAVDSEVHEGNTVARLMYFNR